jgi:signal transduction histidine kinase
MLDQDMTRARQLLALEHFFEEALQTHTRTRVISVVALAGLAAALLPGLAWVPILLGALAALGLEWRTAAELRRIFAVPGSLSAADVARLTGRTIWRICALTWLYCLPYAALAFGPEPGQIFAVLFGTGALLVCCIQHGLTRTMAVWTTLPPLLAIAANAAVLAGPMWPAFFVMAAMLVGNIFVMTGATYRRSVRLIEARLKAQDEAQELEARVAARTSELDAALDMAESASRAKSRFLATMSHELRTPLNAVIGFAEIIKEDAHASGLAAIGTDAARVRAAGLHLLGVINEILDITAIEAGAIELAPRHFAPLKLAEEAVERVRPFALARGNRIELVVKGELGEINADPARVQQCLDSLLTNAAKFTLGGSIELTVERQNGPDGRAGVAFRVADTGIGIASDTLEGLFKPFTQVDDSYNRSADGSGLGLAITRRLARMMGGDVTVESVVGQGSTFTLTVAEARKASPKAA